MRKLTLWTAVALVLLFAGCSDTSSPKPNRTPSVTDYELRLYARAVVTKLLTAPSTARFPHPEIDRDQYTIQRQAGGGCLITGWVDAQNAFGATLRERWKVLMMPQYENGEFARGRNYYIQVGDVVALDRRAEYTHVTSGSGTK